MTAIRYSWEKSGMESAPEGLYVKYEDVVGALENAKRDAEDAALYRWLRRLHRGEIIGELL